MGFNIVSYGKRAFTLLNLTCKFIFNITLKVKAYEALFMDILLRNDSLK